MVLQSVQERARNNGLVLRKFIPKDDVQQENYSGKRIEVSVTSSFASLRSFFDQLAHYQRIVSITNFELKQLDKQSSSKTVDATFDLTAFYVSAEKLQKPAPAAAAKPAGAGKVPPVVVPPQQSNSIDNYRSRKVITEANEIHEYGFAILTIGWIGVRRRKGERANRVNPRPHSLAPFKVVATHLGSG